MYSTMALIDNVVTVYSTKTRIKTLIYRVLPRYTRVTVYSTKTRIKTHFPMPLQFPRLRSQYIPLKQGLRHVLQILQEYICEVTVYSTKTRIFFNSEL